MKLIDQLTFDEKGLIPAIIAKVEDNRPLTLCYMNRQALERTLATGRVHVFRRSQGRLMLKGQHSGHVQDVQRMFVDCEGKSLLLLVKQHVAACQARGDMAERRVAVAARRGPDGGGGGARSVLAGFPLVALVADHVPTGGADTGADQGASATVLVVQGSA